MRFAHLPVFVACDFEFFVFYRNKVDFGVSACSAGSLVSGIIKADAYVGYGRFKLPYVRISGRRAMGFHGCFDYLYWYLLLLTETHLHRPSSAVFFLGVFLGIFNASSTCLYASVSSSCKFEKSLKQSFWIQHECFPVCPCFPQNVKQRQGYARDHLKQGQPMAPARADAAPPPGALWAHAVHPGKLQDSHYLTPPPLL